MDAPVRREPEKLRAVLWDLDGTLADSSEYHWQSWQAVLDQEGVRVTRDDFLRTFGWRNEEILRLWIGPDVTPERVARIGDTKEEAYRDLLRAGGVEPLPGAAEWVRTLRAQGWRQAIASSAPRANIEVMLQVLDFTDLVDAYLGAEDVTRGKPEPEVFLNAAARLGVPPARCVVVEDAAAGIEAGRRGGMATIGVGHGVVDAADLVVTSLADLPPEAFVDLLRGR
jgi:HAD superfamily hydrolase (TIGR01509 family)